MIELFFYIYAQKWDVGVEIGETWLLIFDIYDKNLAVGVENMAHKNFGGKIFLYIAENVPDGYRKCEDMLEENRPHWLNVYSDDS